VERKSGGKKYKGTDIFYSILRSIKEKAKYRYQMTDFRKNSGQLAVQKQWKVESRKKKLTKKKANR